MSWGKAGLRLKRDPLCQGTKNEVMLLLGATSETALVKEKRWEQEGSRKREGGKWRRKKHQKPGNYNYNSHNTNWKQTRTRTNTMIATSRYKQDNDSNHNHNQQPLTTQEPEWTIVPTTSEQHLQFVINPLNFATQNQSAKPFPRELLMQHFFLVIIQFIE